MREIQEMTDALIKFRDDRDWKQFHKSKDLVIAINSEASELLDLFLWKGNEEFDLTKLKEELADIFAFSLLLAEKHGIDIRQIVMDKIQMNGEKYPVDKAKGSAAKYTEL